MRNGNTGTVVYRSVDSMQADIGSFLVPLRLRPDPGLPFQAHVGAGQAGQVKMAHIRGAQGRVLRPPRSITSTDPEVFLVTLHRKGSVTVEQDGRQHRPRPGELAVLDTTRPCRLRYDDPCDVLSMAVPRGLLGPRADALTRRAATPLAGDDGTRAVVGAMFGGLCEALSHLPGAANVRLGEALTALVLAALGDEVGEHAEETAELTDRMLAYVLANLADPRLSVPSVSRRLGISPRRLHRLFEPLGTTFAARVREERLQRVHRDLLDPAFTQRTVAAVAARWGLYDPAHLSRTFKARYGQSPSALRRDAARRDTSMPVGPGGRRPSIG